MRAIKPPFHKGILNGGFAMPQRPRQLPRQRIHHHHGRQLTATEHIVTQRQFLISELFQPGFVSAFFQVAIDATPACEGTCQHHSISRNRNVL